jgi:hypothetical protein
MGRKKGIKEQNASISYGPGFNIKGESLQTFGPTEPQDTFDEESFELEKKKGEDILKEFEYQKFLKRHKDPIGVKETEEEKRYLFERALEEKKKGFRIETQDVINAAGVTLGMGASMVKLPVVGKFGSLINAGKFGSTANKAIGTSWAEGGKYGLVKGGAITQLTSQTGKLGQILKMPVTKLTLGAGALGLTAAGYNQLSTWAALDNTLGHIDMLIRDIKTEMPYRTPKERKEDLATIQEAQSIIDIASAHITESTMKNPILWAGKKIYGKSVEGYMLSLKRNLDYINNYDPLTDKRSLEYQERKGRNNY